MARLDGAASIISILSNDMDGKNLYNNLAANNVDVSGIGFDNAASTGIAYIFVDQERGISDWILSGDKRQHQQETCGRMHGYPAFFRIPPPAEQYS